MPPPPGGGESIPVVVDPFQVDDLVTEDMEVEWNVKWLRYKISGGPSGMQADHLKHCLAEDQDEETSGTTNCLRVVYLVQKEFHDIQIDEK